MIYKMDWYICSWIKNIDECHPYLLFVTFGVVIRIKTWGRCHKVLHKEKNMQYGTYHCFRIMITGEFPAQR